jgi:riboflavin synthase
MFTGIVEALAKVVKVEKSQSNIHFTLQTQIAGELHIDQSLCHDGVCLTVVSIDKDHQQYQVTAVQETLDRSGLKQWVPGTEVNLERSMKMDGRFDGHIVQGHVDQTATCTKVESQDGSWKYTFRYDPSLGNITVEKGSITVNGVSLTVVDSDRDFFTVAIIPYTYEVTNFHSFQEGTIVNLEFDVIGKYISRLLKMYLEEMKSE